MSTTLANCLIELSKQLGDYWASTTTGTNTTTAVIDTALKAKANDWVGDNSYDFITSATCLNEERKISSLDNTSGTLTVLAHSGTGPGASATYEVHRLFTPSDKRIALIAACRNGFPDIFEKIVNESKTVGDWLKDGDVEKWTSSSVLTNWTVSGCTLAQEATIKRRGSYSAKLTTATGYLYQNDTHNPDLLNLAGQSVRFKCKAWCDTASALRLAVYDGTTTTYSSYHPGGSVWSDAAGYGSLPYWLSVDVNIRANPASVVFSVYKDVAAAIAYVDDLRVIGPTYDKVYVGDIGFAQDRPIQVSQVDESSVYRYPWQPLAGCWLDDSQYLHMPYGTQDSRLRLEGLGYLDFLASGASSTAWTATVNINNPQTDILVAEAAVYLCNQMIMPNYDSNTTSRWKEALAWWMNEREIRKRKFSMPLPPISSWIGF